jgi:hypothetical protein
METLRRFNKGEVVVYADGVVWRENDDFDDTYALILPGYERNADGSEGPPLYYDLADQTRWINHSCDPNCEVDSAYDPVTGTVTPWWVARRDIEIGEELTYDYAFSGHLAEPCNCGTAKCRGLIVDDEELHLVPEKLRHLLRVPAAVVSEQSLR